MTKHGIGNRSTPIKSGSSGGDRKCSCGMIDAGLWKKEGHVYGCEYYISNVTRSYTDTTPESQQPKGLVCKKHSRILIGKKKCVDCEAELKEL